MTRLVAILLSVALGWSAAAAQAQQRGSRDRRERSGSGPTFDSFRIVLDRNIFDPNRRRQRDVRRSFPEPRRSLPAPTERLLLAGAFIHDEGSSKVVVAFFEGSRPEYSATAKLGDTIAGHRIIAIRTDRVFLEKEGRRIDLPVGAGLRRQGDEPWQVVADLAYSERSRPTVRSPDRRERRSPSSRDSATTQSEEASADKEPSDASADEILKRLMERRRQETR